MAVRDMTPSLHHVTENLIQDSPRRYYKAYMAAEHWQLRSFISSPKSNIVYYIHRTEVRRMNTTTKEREIVTTLPFSPKCLAATSEFICCGGDDGHFAVIKTENRAGSRNSYSTGVDGEADSRLPLNLESNRRINAGSSSDGTGLRRRELPSMATIVKVGKEIINCITIRLPKAELPNQAYSNPVAVLANNDRSVSIVSLPEGEILDSVELEDCVNRALMSPDGELLVMVGDDPYMYLYQKTYTGPKIARKVTWVKIPKVRVHDQPRGDAIECRGSFATAFSPSGRYLAVGTQFGQVSVYETRFLTNSNVDPLIVTFTTSRPTDRDGAIRSMEFSPEPFDLLAWTEHSSRIIVADLRRSFMSRQTIVISPDDENIEKVPLTDHFDENLIDPRLRLLRNDSDGSRSNPAADRGHTSSSLTSLARGVLARQNIPLTREETAVLEALQLDRRQREREREREREPRQPQPSNTPYTPLSWSDLVDDVRSYSRLRQMERQELGDDSALRRLPASLSSSARENDSLRTYVHDLDRRERQGQQQQRRRASMMLAATARALDRDLRDQDRDLRFQYEETRREATATRERLERLSATLPPGLPASLFTNRDLTNNGDRVSQLPPRLPAIGSDILRNPWTEIEALYNIAVDQPAQPDTASRLRVEIETENRREFTRRQEERWTGREVRNQVLSGVARDRETELSQRTTGCCWSHDGRILYFGLENGIYELHVNISSRKSFPCIIPR